MLKIFIKTGILKVCPTAVVEVVVVAVVVVVCMHSCMHVCLCVYAYMHM